MTWVGWQPVIVALQIAIVGLIPVAALYLRTWFQKQTEDLSKALASSQSATQSALRERADLTRQLVEKMQQNDLRITIAAEPPKAPTVETSPPLGELPSGSTTAQPTTDPTT